MCRRRFSAPSRVQSLATTIGNTPPTDRFKRLCPVDFIKPLMKPLCAVIEITTTSQRDHKNGDIVNGFTISIAVFKDVVQSFPRTLYQMVFRLADARIVKKVLVLEAIPK